MTSPALELISALGWSSRARSAPYFPVLRAPYYLDVPIPESWKKLERITVVEVETSEELAELFKEASRRGVGVYVRQGAGDLTAETQNPQTPGSLVVDLSRMSWIRPNFDSAYVEIGPAVTEKELNEALTPHGYAFPELIGPVTWGTLVSLNASGRSVDPSVGKAGDHVLGLRVVIPTGEILDTGTRAQRRLCGMDLSRIFIGCQTILGVITGIRLRLVPAPRHLAHGVARMSSARLAATAIGALYRAKLPYPRLLELMDEKYLKLTEIGDTASGSLLMIATDAWTAEEAVAKLNAIFEVLEQQRALQLTRLTDVEWKTMVRVREEIVPQLRRLGLCELIGENLDCPLPAFPDCVDMTNEILEDLEQAYPGLVTFTTGHAGVGSYHPCLAAPVSWGFERLAEVSRDFRNRVAPVKLRYGATVGDQGLFPKHAGWFVGAFGRRHLDLLISLKKVFDPQGILNPGRLEPIELLHEATQESGAMA